MSPVIRVVVPAHNEQEDLGRCLEALRMASAHGPPLEIMVVDNASTDATATIAEATEGVRVRRTDVSIGAARNLGARGANGPFIAFLDADCLAEPDWVERATELMRQDSSIGIVSGILTLEDVKSTPWVERYWVARQRSHYPDRVTWTQTVSSFCFVVRTELFERLGGFDATLTTSEDVDLGRRAHAAGFRIAITRDIEVVHLGNPKNLGAFFRRELWHGRSQVRHVLKHVHQPREVLSFLVPIAFVAGLALSFTCLALGAWSWGLSVAAATLAGLVAFTLQRSPVRRLRDVVPFAILWSCWLIARAVGPVLRRERSAR